MGFALFPTDKRENGRTDLTRLAVSFVLRKRPKSATVAAVLHGYKTWSLTFFFKISLFHRAFHFTKFYLYQRMHLFLSYTKIT